MSSTASEIFKLHKETGMSIMDCKEALAEANGDVEAAIEFLRNKVEAEAEALKPKYALVTGGAGSSDELNKFWMDITDLINSGWRCQGGVSVTLNNRNGVLVFHQAMVRD